MTPSVREREAREIVGARAAPLAGAHRVSADVARAALAARWLGAVGGDGAPRRLGTVELLPHQRDAVVRVRSAMHELGGALLADDVGMGKTFVALALAREAERPVVVAPASLRATWRDAMARAATEAPFLSFEMLGRGRGAGVEPDLVIVDESHHARNPATRRHRALAALCRHARVLLLSATPIHNRRAELVAQLALFLGARAAALDEASLARCIVRRRAEGSAADALPRVLPPRLLPLAGDDRVLDALLALPPPVPPADGGDGGALVAFGLVRQWASSRSALVAALRRRLALALALESALEQGRLPTRAELASWSIGADAVQLGFPELLATAAPESASLLAALHVHASAVRELLALARRAPDPDDERARRLDELRAAHPGERIVAFTQYAETATALFRRLAHRPGVGVLTARGGRVAGGALSRRELLARFAPRGTGVAEPPPIERVELLVATDLLSEGVNLQDASVVVHLDLPWTPARVEQRIGRARRLGAARDRIAVYVVPPPARAESLLATERRLREKLRAAARTVGVAGSIVPSLLPAGPAAGTPAGGTTPARATEATGDDGPSAPECMEALRATLAGWRAEAAPDDAPFRTTLGTTCEMSPDVPLVAAARGDQRGILALVEPAPGDAAPALLVAAIGPDDGARADALADALADAPRVVLRAARLAGGESASISDGELADALRSVHAWCARRAASGDAGIAVAHVIRGRRALLRRIARVVGRAPPHLRQRLAPLAAEARRVASAPLPGGAERVLGELAAAELPDEPWLRALAAFAALHPAWRRGGGGGGRGAGEREPAYRPTVVIVLATGAPEVADGSGARAAPPR